MKLLRWAMAGASVYVVYKYTIDGKARGEGDDVFKTPEGSVQAPSPTKIKPKRTHRLNC